MNLVEAGKQSASARRKKKRRVQGSLAKVNAARRTRPIENEESAASTSTSIPTGIQQGVVGKVEMDDSTMEQRFFVGIDIGTTNIRACLFDSAFRMIAYEQNRIELITSVEDELSEIDPEDLWSQLRHVLRKVLSSVPSEATVLTAGLCCQRNTFISWDLETQRPCHRLVTWKDGRGKSACVAYNNSFRLKLLNWIGAICYFLTGSERFKAAKILRFVSAMVTHRFIATLKRNEEMKKLLAQSRLAIGCMDTWLLYRLTNGRVFITEPSAISVTGLFDPFLRDYGKLLLRLIGFPVEVRLPTIIDTTAVDVLTNPDFLDGRSLRITASIGDTQSAAFGAGCQLDDSLSICLGTGTFFDIVVGDRPRISAVANSSIFPLVGWRIDGHCKFVIEGHMSCSATVVDWAHRLGLLEDIDRASEIARCTEPAKRLHFVPGRAMRKCFEGIETPVNDELACGGLLGLHSGITKAQIVRALLESIAFSIAQMYETCMRDFHGFRVSFVRVSGGVSSNDFICQQIANLINLPIERVTDNRFCASRGAALLAAIGSGYIDVSDVKKFVTVESVFTPGDESERNASTEAFNAWKDSQRRCCHFYR